MTDLSIPIASSAGLPGIDVQPKPIADRRAAAADLAFDRRDFTGVRRIQALLPPGHMPAARRAKGWISRLPHPVAVRAAAIASRLAPRGG